MILVKGGTLSDDAFTKLQAYMNEIEGEKGQHSFLVLETDTSETATTLGEQKQPEVEIKDLAAILQKDELFQEYQENGRKKTQSAFFCFQICMWDIPPILIGQRHRQRWKLQKSRYSSQKGSPLRG